LSTAYANSRPTIVQQILQSDQPGAEFICIRENPIELFRRNKKESLDNRAFRSRAAQFSGMLLAPNLTRRELNSGGVYV
jgi:hypothetical protein